MYLQLFSEGKTWEEAREIVDKQDFEDRIEKVVYPNGKKKEKEYKIGERYLFLVLIGCTTTDRHLWGGGPLYLNGKIPYNRLFIKSVGTGTYLGNGVFDMEIFDEEGYNSLLNGGYYAIV